MMIPKGSTELRTEKVSVQSDELIEDEQCVPKSGVTEEFDHLDFGINYEVLSLIGRGGMGSVYKVRDRQLGSIFAIKTLNKSLVKDQIAQKRFEKEVEAASKLSHPSLVTVYGHGITSSGTPYMVMDYVDGQSLDEIIDDVGALEPERACNILLQVAEGLQFAHSQGIVHRDIKPTNVLITKNGDLEIAKLVDFGIAMILPTESRETRDLTQTGEVFGSPHYMSPEQCLGFLIDNRSDIYSFGCMMYKTLTGRPPFSGSTPVQLIIDHINTDPKPFPRSVICSRLLTMMQRITMKCLLKEQGLRYQTVDDLLKDLQSAKSGKAIRRIAKSFKVKFALTKERVAAVVGFCLLKSLYAPPAHFYSPELPDFISNGVNLAGPILLSIYCGIVALHQSFLRTKKLHNEKATARSWLSIIMLMTGGSAAILAIPKLFCDLLQDIPDPVYAIAIISKVVGQLSFLILTTSVVAYLLLGKQNLVRLKFVTVRLVAMLIIWFFVSTVANPQIAVNELASWASECEETFPRTSIALLKLSHKIDPNQAKNQFGPLSRAAKLETNMGLFQDAIATVSTMISNVPKKSRFFGESLYLKRAQLYIRTGQLDKAEEDIRAFASEVAHPDLTEASNVEDLVLREPTAAAYVGLIRSRQDKYDEAIKYYELALQMDPSYHSAAYNFRIGTYARHRQFDKALADINRPLKARVFQYKSYLKRAIIYENSGQKKLAQDDYLRVCKIFEGIEKRKEFGYAAIGDGNETHLCKAFAYYKSGRMDDYKKELQRAIETNYGNTEIKSNLPYCLQLGQSNLKWDW